METQSSRMPVEGTNDHDRRSPGRLTWIRLVYLSGVASTIAVAVVSAYLFDIEGALVALLYALFTWLFSSGKRLAGVAGLMVVSGATAFFMTTAALINLRGYGGAEGVVLSLGLSSVSTLTLFAGIGYLIRRDAPSSFGPWVLVAILGLNTLQPFLGGALSREPDSEFAEIELVAENVAYSETEIATGPGHVSLSLANRDLFWHTFTIEELDVDLRVPLSATMTVTFEAPPGEYRYFCDIPGHVQAGMEGLLVVEG